MGGDITVDDNLAIRVTSQFGYPETVKFLLENGADPTVKDNFALENAKTQEIRDLLIQWKYRVDGPEYQRMRDLTV